MKLTPPQPPIERDLDALRIGLSGYNQAVAGSHLREQVASFIKDEQGLVLGGILADIKWGWLHIDWLWIDERIRKEGWGGRLLASMEQYAGSKGIINVHLETTSFQALPFYQKQGYAVFGELPDMPPGHITYFLKKRRALPFSGLRCLDTKTPSRGARWRFRWPGWRDQRLAERLPLQSSSPLFRSIRLMVSR